VILVDTGPIVAAALTRDTHHRACVDLFTAAHLAGDALAVPAPVVTEACYLLAREAGSRAEAAFLDSLGHGDLEVVDLEPVDWCRAAELVRRYADLPLGAVDASVVAVPERLRIAGIATIDRRHFSIVRPRHVDAFTLLPH
jgi:predicted nucleic acid-binding protein